MDTTCDFVSYSGDNSKVKENYAYIWCYQNVDKISENPKTLMQLDAQNSWYSLSELRPPVIINMEHFRIWLVIYDYTNDLRWPREFAIKGVKGIFKYTEAYKKSVQ